MEMSRNADSCKASKSRKLEFLKSRSLNLSALLLLIFSLPLVCSASVPPSMDRWAGKIAVVTEPGPSEMTLLEDLVDYEMKVIALTGSVGNIEALADLKNKTGGLHAIEVDITSTKQIIDAFKEVEDKFGPVSVLVNAADIYFDTRLLSDDVEKWRETLDTNIIALCTATREAVNSMKKHNIDGHIILKNDIDGQKPWGLPGENIYPASKYAVTALTESLRSELLRDKTKIKITSISPSHFISSEETVEYSDKKGEYFTPLHPEDLSNAIIYALSTPPLVQVHELMLRSIGNVQR